jgi:hypothetical protein
MLNGKIDDKRSDFGVAYILSKKPICILQHPSKVTVLCKGKWKKDNDPIVPELAKM